MPVPNQGRIAVLCPTKGRPDLLTRFWRSAKHSLADIAVYVERDDPALRSGYMSCGLPLHIGPPRSYSEKLNVLASRMHGYAAYFTAEDDYVCVNPRWAQIYLDALPHGVVALAADECEQEWWPHTAAMSSEWVSRLGGLHPEVVQHYHLTSVWADIAQAANCAVRVTERCWEHQPAGSRTSRAASDDRAAWLGWRARGGPWSEAEKLTVVQGCGRTHSPTECDAESTPAGERTMGRGEGHRERANEPAAVQAASPPQI